MSADKVLKKIKDEGVEYVDLRFTDPKGKWQHVTFDKDMVDEDFFRDGSMFDGSSISGWKAINESDMVLMPDTDTAIIDPFFAAKTLSITCDVLEPESMKAYNRDPRTTAKAAEAYLAETGIGNKAFFGPEAEFFVFEDVRISTNQNSIGFRINSDEGPYNMNAAIEGGNLGHRPRAKGGYFPVPPVDSEQDMRSEMLRYMREMGIRPEKHHHEVAPSQHELGMKFSTLTDMADQMQIYKYVVQQVADSFGKTATFMPKPVLNDNGSGMHVHQSIWMDDQPVFAGDQYAGLSETCLYYIGGIIKHAKAINAFANATTNSYKRLVPGFEAPVLLAYSARNRSASIRIPWVSSAKAKRIETRFPDAGGNPYYTFAALFMAGLDGIQNKIHPGDPLNQDLYAMSEAEQKDIPTVARSLQSALEELDADRAFLKKGDVFNDDQIDSYIDLKMEEVTRYNSTPHPVEFDMYYSV
ncbi:type I glutamate--ammonia ligase [Parvularcula maris]|uniref:Glutamine synthetase n=1 Tax=Parvularcula maris TaxID=2965077 RepID=A0A9X2LBB5_9PROT|nr:type I glutamate--ammonia ligase [Parvularcula maris]MCQ8186561.1 type I glutamate--ammonia ligase [Parvularcula maris]